MAIDLDADLLTMMDTADFAVAATFESVLSGISISSANIVGHFVRDAQVVLDVESHSIAFVCRSIDIAGVKHGDWITVAGVKYIIVGTPFHADGEATLDLEV